MDQNEVVQRALALKAVVAFALSWPDREQLEKLTPSEQKEANEAAERFLELVRQSGAYESLSPAERAFLAQRCPQISDPDVLQFTWRAEAYKVLLWALGLVEELGPYHRLAAPALVGLKAADIRERARLRPDEEIVRARQVAELWHWRSRSRELGLEDEEELVAVAARAAHRRGDLEAVVEDDFGVEGAPYCELSERDFQTVSSLTRERHQALNWLCQGGAWDEVGTET